MSHDVEELTDPSIDFEQFDGEVEAALRRQDEALMLLDRLREEEPFARNAPETAEGERRVAPRWSTPPGVTVQLHDGRQWWSVACPDIGVGGVRTEELPDWADGPTPVRLKTPGHPAVIALADVMWREAGTGKAGLRFEFVDNAEREHWTESLVDALLASQALR